MAFLTAAAMEERLIAGERDGKRDFAPSEDSLTEVRSAESLLEKPRKPQTVLQGARCGRLYPDGFYLST